MLTEQQRKDRVSGLGASDSPIIMGYSAYKTPYELYLEKTGILSIEDDKMSEQQYWGNMLEATIRNHFSIHNEVSVDTPGTVFHKDYPFIFANLDGFVADWNAVLEIKCANSFMKSEWDNALEDGIPMQYLIQIAKQVAITNADIGYCAVLIGGCEYREYTYHRDPELEKMIIESDVRFWECVQKRIEPEPIAVSDLVLMYPNSEKKGITVTNSVHMDVEFMKMEKEKIKEHEKKFEQYKMNVMRYMKDADCLLDMDNRPIATWKQSKKGSRTFLIK